MPVLLSCANTQPTLKSSYSVQHFPQPIRRGGDLRFGQVLNAEQLNGTVQRRKQCWQRSCDALDVPDNFSNTRTTFMSTIQLAINDPAYARWIRSLLLSHGAEHQVYITDLPKLNLDGVIVIDRKKFETLSLARKYLGGSS